MSKYTIELKIVLDAPTLDLASEKLLFLCGEAYHNHDISVLRCDPYGNKTVEWKDAFLKIKRKVG